MSLAVLITYYNERELLTQCLASLAAQTTLPDEIWVYDDASSAPAHDYLGSYASLAGGVKVIRGKQNRGPAFGRNTLLAQSQSDFVHFHDCDDLFLPGWTHQVSRAATKAVDLVLTELNSIKNGAPYGNRFLALSELLNHHDLFRFSIQHAILPAAGTYRRQFVLDCGGYRTDLWQSEDYEFHARLALAGARFAALPEPLVLVHVREASRSQIQSEVWQGRLQGLQLLEARLPNKQKKVFGEAYAEVGGHLFRMGDRGAARVAFIRAASHGAYFHPNDARIHRYLASALGAYSAHRLAVWYRAFFPEVLRRLVRYLGKTPRVRYESPNA